MLQPVANYGLPLIKLVKYEVFENTGRHKFVISTHSLITSTKSDAVTVIFKLNVSQISSNYK